MTKDRHKAVMNLLDLGISSYVTGRYFKRRIQKANLDIKSVTDNKKFWQTIKPFFYIKVKAKSVIKLVENKAMIDDESEIKNFNEYFVNIVKKLGILTEEQTTYSATNKLSEVEMAVIK